MNTVNMPKLGDTMEEGKIVNWLVKEGDTIAKGDPLAEIETEKVTIPVEAFAPGVVRKILVPAGETVAVGTAIAYTGTADEPLPQESAPATQSGQQAPTPASRQETPAAASSGQNHSTPPGTVATLAAPAEQNGRVFISPIARRIAAEHNVDIATVHGSGPGGRIIREDVEALVTAQLAQPAVNAPAQPVEAAPGEEVRAVPLSNMRKTIARRLQQSMQTVPHFYVTVAVDATKLGAFRTQANEYAAGLAQPVKISVNDLVVKGVASALSQMPEVNVSFDGERLLLKKHINVGVAVALEQGLIVPVIRDADKRGVLDIARESRRLVESARGNKLRPEDFQGGTFSVSNLGMFDVEEFTAIINPPEAAILAVGSIVPTPVVRDGQVVARDIMKCTLSVDHRALDGAMAARFLQQLKRLLEEPLSMLL